MTPKQDSDTEKIKLADEWLDKNGHKWSNNDDTAGDNFGSFIAGYDAGRESMRAEVDALKETIRVTLAPLEGLSLCAHCMGENHVLIRQFYLDVKRFQEQLK